MIRHSEPRNQAEALARVLYAVKRDPHDAALYYAALGKTTLLQGAFASHVKSLLQSTGGTSRHPLLCAWCCHQLCQGKRAMRPVAVTFCLPAVL